MTVRTATALRARWALGVLLAVLVALSVLAHHELMAPMAGSAGPMPMATTSAPAAMTADPMAVAACTMLSTQRGAHTAHTSFSATALTCGGSEGMCTAAGIAAAPLPAALPAATTAAATLPPLHGCVRPLPPGTGPPPPADTSSVLRI
jgi:hypothetical protein